VDRRKPQKDRKEAEGGVKSQKIKRVGVVRIPLHVRRNQVAIESLEKSEDSTSVAAGITFLD